MIDVDQLATREEYDAHVATWPEESRWQWWPVPWRVATRRERVVKVALWAAQSIAIAACVAAVIALDTALVDNYARMVEMRDRCLKSSTNGFEIRQCDRGLDTKKPAP